jgi:hypothetical protein
VSVDSGTAACARSSVFYQYNGYGMVAFVVAGTATHPAAAVAAAHACLSQAVAISNTTAALQVCVWCAVSCSCVLLLCSGSSRPLLVPLYKQDFGVFNDKTDQWVGLGRLC